jgi:hypothetical protein
MISRWLWVHEHVQHGDLTITIEVEHGIAADKSLAHYFV